MKMINFNDIEIGTAYKLTQSSDVEYRKLAEDRSVSLKSLSTSFNHRDRTVLLVENKEDKGALPEIESLSQWCSIEYRGAVADRIREAIRYCEKRTESLTQGTCIAPTLCEFYGEVRELEAIIEKPVPLDNKVVLKTTTDLCRLLKCLETKERGYAPLTPLAMALCRKDWERTLFRVCENSFHRLLEIEAEVYVSKKPKGFWESLWK